MNHNENRPICCGKSMNIYTRAVSGRTRYRCTRCGTSTTGSSESHYQNAHLGYDTNAAAQRTAELQQAVRHGANRFVITSAVNNCEVNYRAFASLRMLCQERGAHLIVLPVNYKNVSLYKSAQEYSKWWARSVQPYLMDQKLRIATNTWVRGDISIQATAAQPLSGMQPLAGATWSIFGHPQLAMEPIATPLMQLPGRMYTTGAITQPVYSRTKLGAKAGFHHVIGALLVEVHGKKVFIRQLNADHQGCIYDLDRKYTPAGAEAAEQALALVTGDEHAKWMLPGVKRATYTGEASLVDLVKPRNLVRHDLLDGYAGSHHHLGDYRAQYLKWVRGTADYRKELDQVVLHLQETTPTAWECVNQLIQDSNHHDHLQKWLNTADDRADHLNADLICELRSAQREAIRDGRDDNAFRLYLEPRLKVPLNFIDPGQTLMIGGVDHSQHGHRGPNGAKGTARSLANTTHKLTIGHSHSARIVMSVYQVGKSTGVLEYESGLSTHTNTHCLMYANGKRTLIDILGGAYRASNDSCSGGLEVLGNRRATVAA